MNQYPVTFANSGGLWAEPQYYSLHALVDGGFPPLFNGPISGDIWSLGVETSTLTVSEDAVMHSVLVCLESGSCGGVFYVSLHTGLPTAANELVDVGYQREPLRFSNWRVS